MRLLQARDKTFAEFLGSDIPPYAIISHRWSNEEISHQEFFDGREEFVAGRQKGYGWVKVHMGCKIALERGYEYIWIDTICIDKKSSAELSEAINSMYFKSGECFVFLRDVHSKTLFGYELKTSQWFTRGWTLQELLAPKKVSFFEASFQHLGDKLALKSILSAATAIDEKYIGSPEEITNASVAERMRWASNRTTTRTEDIAYCLLGIFDINMPLLYGEGAKAFVRLQIEILRKSQDETIFAWEQASIQASKSELKQAPSNILASSPSKFRQNDKSTIMRWDFESRRHYEITNRGVRMDMRITQASILPERSTCLLPLNCVKEEVNEDGTVELRRVAIKVYVHADEDNVILSCKRRIKNKEDDDDGASLVLAPNSSHRYIENGKMYDRFSNLAYQVLGRAGSDSSEYWQVYLEQDNR